MKRNYITIKYVLTIVGAILLVGGLILSIIGFVNFGNFDNNLFTLTLVGIPCIGFGTGLIMFSLQQNINKFVANSAAKVVNEFTQEITPALSTYASTVNNATDDAKKVCTCGEINRADAKFCTECGRRFENNKE